MGALDSFLKYMKLNDEEEGEYYDDDYDDGYDDEPGQPARKKQPAVKEAQTAAPAEERTVKKVVPKITPMKPAAKRDETGGKAGGMEVCVIKPTSVEDAKEITDTLRDNRTVVLNLEGLDMDIAQRIIDYTSGSCYAIDGTLQKISKYIFIITPPSVLISGDYQEIMGSALDMPPI